MADAMTRLLDSIEATGDQDDQLSPRDLYEAYRQYARDAGETTVLSSGSFHRRIVHEMAACGIHTRRSDKRVFDGVRLNRVACTPSVEDCDHETGSIIALAQFDALIKVVEQRPTTWQAFWMIVLAVLAVSAAMEVSGGWS
ncbi:hypothetical protein [Martelella sp. FOR1707]